MFLLFPQLAKDSVLSGILCSLTTTFILNENDFGLVIVRLYCFFKQLLHPNESPENKLRTSENFMEAIMLASLSVQNTFFGAHVIF